jgi:hypothetical protein
MTHSFPDFTAHVLNLLEKSGPTGPNGPIPTNLFISNEKAGTSCRTEVGPVDFEWSRPRTSTGPGKAAGKQSLIGGGTTGTSGTTIFEQGGDQCERGGAPTEWHALLAELERCACPDWMSHGRWDLLLADTENFLTRWGSTANALGWKARDLYGVHRVAPGARFDAMGFLFFVQGGSVPLITAHSASIHRRTGARLTYRRRPNIADAVLLSTLLTPIDDLGAHGEAGGPR